MVFVLLSMISVLSGFAIVFLRPCGCWCSCAPPHGAVGWTALLYCGISYLLYILHTSYLAHLSNRLRVSFGVHPGCWSAIREI